MIRIVQSPLDGHTRVVFELPNDLWADRIYLVGDFNNWNPRDTTLNQNRNGTWQTMLDLPSGRSYQFRYLINGDWYTDNQAESRPVEQNGLYNSVVTTPPLLSA